MTATPEGIIGLFSPDCYKHYEIDDLEKSAEKGCTLCALISNVISAGFYGYEDVSDGIDISVRSLQYMESGDSALIYAVEGDEVFFRHHEADESPQVDHLDFLSVSKMRRLSVGLASEEGSYYVGLNGQPASFIKISTSTDPEAPRFSNPLVLAEKLKSEERPHSVAVAGARVDGEIKRCFNECITSHCSTCPSNLNSTLPRRVIDVESNQEPEKLSLHLTNSGERAKYAALSYFWGDPPHPFVTTRETLEDPSKFDWGQAPATIRDAILVTRGLGIRYLWVDALCIIQGDEIDKTEEIREMGMIYKNATITISAASSPNVNSGFLEDRPVTNFPMPVVSPEGDYGALWIRGPNITPHDEPLDKRGWKLQETMLSPRMLYYSSKDLIWKCQKKTFEPVVASHDLYSVLPSPASLLPPSVFNIPSQKEIKISEFWSWIQISYSNRHLQLFEDRFRAIGGIAEELEKVSNDIYIAGPWKGSIVKDLAWGRLGNIVKDEREHLSYQSPSWSWLAYFRPVNTHYTGEDIADGKRPELLS